MQSATQLHRGKRGKRAHTTALKAFCLAAVVFAVGCLNDDDRFTGVDTSKGSITAMVGASSYASSSVNTTVTGDERLITGFGNSRLFELHLKGITAPGTYSLGGVSQSYVGYVMGTTTWQTVGANAGTLVITAINGNTWTGTFEGTLVPVLNGGSSAVISLTAGTFNVVF